MMKHIKYFISTLCVLFAFFACEQELFDVSIKFDKESYEVEVGKSLDLFEEVEVTGSLEVPSFSSSDTTVALVSKEGVVSALAPGESTVTAAIKGKSATCTVVVPVVKASSITLLPAADTTLIEGETYSLVAKVEPASYDPENLEWTFTPQPSSVSEVFTSEKVSASEYKLTFSRFVSGGSVLVRVRDLQSKISATGTVRVAEKPLEGATELSLSPETIEVNLGAEPDTLVVTTTPEDYDRTRLIWTSSDEKVATVKDGVVTYIARGAATITVTDPVSGLEAKCVVNVGGGVTSISLSPKSLDVVVGAEPVALVVSCTPENYDKSVLVWTSSDEKVATVDENGVVTFLAEGAAEIIVSDPFSEHKAVCNVKVTEGVTEARIKSITVDPSIVVKRLGEEPFQIKTICRDEDGNIVENYSDLQWSATKTIDQNNEEIDVVEVSAQGVVTLKAVGTTVVTVCDRKNNAVKATCSITVSKAEVKAESVVMSQTEVTTEKDQTLQLTATIRPADTEDKALVWASSDEKIATVDQTGKVTTIEYGKTVISATTTNGISGYCTVNVVDSKIYVTEVKLNNTELSLKVGASQTLKAVVSPENATDPTVTWTTSDEAVATVNAEGLVTAVKEGEAVITATADGKSATCKVTVEKVAVEKVTISTETWGMTIGETHTLTVAIQPENATYKDVTWKSSDEAVVTVDNTGKITAVEVGSADITATVDGVTAKCAVTVAPLVIPVESIEIAGEAKVKVGETITLTATIIPEGAEGTVNWSSSDPSKATVKDGVVIGVSDGKVEIIASCGEVSASHAVEVLPIEVESVAISDKTLTLVKGNTKQLSFTVAPENAKIEGTVWSVDSGSDIVTVSENGLVTAVAPGSATVSVTVSGVKSDVCSITVEGIKPESITLTPSTYTMVVDEVYEGLEYVISPTDCDYKDVEWSSSDASIVAVDQKGVLTAKAVGSATVTVKTVEGDCKAQCVVTVENIDFSIKFDQTYSVPQFETIKLTPSYTPIDVNKYGETYTPKATSWSSRDESLATVDQNGNVTAVYDGFLSEDTPASVLIDHTADGETKSVEVTITQAHPKSIAIGGVPANNTIYIGDRVDFTATVTPAQASQSVLWSCHSPASTSSGEIAPYGGTFTPKHVGTYTVRAQGRDRFGYIYDEVTIEVLPIEITNATISQSSLELYEGDKTTLTVSIEPYNATYKQIAWATSDESVVKISQASEITKGDVEAVGAGSAQITATLSNGTVLTCDVTVKEVEVSTVAVGDYYYSDGTTSSELDATKTVVGVVFSLENAASQDPALKSKMQSLGKDKVTGLVMSLKQTTRQKEWDKLPNAFVSDWATSNGYNTLIGVKYENNAFVATEQGHLFCGYNNTQAIRAYMATDAYTTAGNDINLLDDCPDTDVANTSGWYVPSYAELNALVANQDLVTGKITAAGGKALAQGKHCYWTSTEGNQKQMAVAIRLTGGTGSENMFNAQKEKSSDAVNNRYYVRYIFAF